VILSGILFISDLRYPGDALFQSSVPLVVVGLFLFVYSLVAHFIAVMPKRFVLATNLLLCLRAAYGFPFSRFLQNTPACVITSGLLLAVSVVYLIAAKRRELRMPIRPWASWKHTLIVALIGVVMMLGLIPVIFSGLTQAVKNLMGDYFVIHRGGVNLVERVYEKDGQKVFLIGMMHIGHGEFYTDLQRRLITTPEGSSKRLILTEGVRDESSLMPSLSTGESYGGFADQFGLQVQGRLDGYSGHGAETLTEEGSNEHLAGLAERGIVFENADIDISELSEKHRDLLIMIFDLMGSSPMEMMVAQPPGMTGLDVEDFMMNGLIIGRNDVLMEAFEVESPGYEEVYIPWGAAHLKDIEERFIALGYTKIDEIERPILRIRDVLAYLQTHPLELPAR